MSGSPKPTSRSPPPRPPPWRMCAALPRKPPPPSWHASPARRRRRLRSRLPSTPRSRAERIAMIELIFEPETWVAIAFVIFVAIMVRLGVPRLVTKTLDDRSARIKTELDEAMRLRQEAEAVLAQYRRKQQEAEAEAAAIIVSARAEAERLAAE